MARNTGAPQSPPLSPSAITRRLESIDGAAMKIWRAQHELGDRVRPTETAPATEKTAYRTFLGEKAKLFIEFQRLRAAASDLALRRGETRSSAHLVRSESRIFLEPRHPRDSAGNSTLVVHEIYGQDRHLQFDHWNLAEGRTVGRVIDRRYGVDPEQIAFRVRPPAGGAEWPVRNREGRTVFPGTALSVVVYNLASDWLKAGDGNLILSSAYAADNRRCSSIFYDFTSEFEAPAGQVSFQVRVAADDTPSGRAPRVTYEIVDFTTEPSAAAAPRLHSVDCNAAERPIEWSELQGGVLVPAAPRAGWTCQVDVDNLEQTRMGVVVVRIELPYSGCPLLEDTIPAGAPSPAGM